MPDEAPVTRAVRCIGFLLYFALRCEMRPGHKNMESKGYDPSTIPIPTVNVVAATKVTGVERIRVQTHTHSHSSARIDLRCLFTDFCRIDDEFERICVLILFHQLEIGEALSAFYRIASGKLRLCGFDQIRCNRIPPVCGQAVHCIDDLRLR